MKAMQKNRSCIVVQYILKVYHTSQHDIFLTLHLDKISSDHIKIETCLYAYPIQNINNYELIPGTAQF
jgi:hypothetical protein